RQRERAQRRQHHQRGEDVREAELSHRRGVNVAGVKTRNERRETRKVSRVRLRCCAHQGVVNMTSLPSELPEMQGLPEVVMPACPINQILKGEKALVTGGSSGIGQAIAIALAHAGADVVVNYRSEQDGAERTVQEALRCGSRAYAHQA